MLKRRADRLTLLFCALSSGVYALHWVYPCLPLFAVSCLQAFQMSVVVHNAAHCGTFANRLAERAFRVALTILSGSPTSLYVPGHNESHHRHLETEKDMMRTSRMKYDSDALNLLLFAPTVIPDVIRNERAFMRAKRGSDLHRRYVTESTCYHCLLVLLCVANWRKALRVYVVPTLVGKACIITLNMLQHYRCDPSSQYNHSRNFTGAALNFVFLNNGYHTVHHIRPGLHWSLLPAEHERVKGFIHPSLIHRNILRYAASQHFRLRLWQK